ncbi:hypothetical protein Goarm_014216 [Gossypium armourianum]|uniref:Uncharacterized protein n=1 Tax=Gossypium armourianum TaxID=34283 RepID=A0A7J9J6X4_9ROSI|nr:hypothetical protein [Gossypium armourianum]
MTNSLGDLADGGSVSVCDRNTKKVRFKDRNSDLDSEMANGMDDDFFLLDGDIKRSSVNGIPSIEFSDRVNQILIKNMATSVVLKLVGRNIGFAALQNRIYGI